MDDPSFRDACRSLGRLLALHVYLLPLFWWTTSEARLGVWGLAPIRSHPQKRPRLSSRSINNLKTIPRLHLQVYLARDGELSVGSSCPHSEHTNSSNQLQIQAGWSRALSSSQI
ncbi:hypothetical protein DL95DRAFT_27694 [Leptodontidium sp. 2 PMI_412]|nr:hypothetical protein DL95DRAFT_27694 [Leptodontidium sp. 2 PMI_412]